MILKIIIWIALPVLGIFLFGYFRLKYIQWRQRADFFEIFGGCISTTPTLEFSSSYWYPRFIVTFQNKSDLDFATRNKLTEDFKDRIRSYYDSNFDADLAVVFSCKKDE